MARIVLFLTALLVMPLTVSAQRVNPTGTYIDEEGNEVETNSVDKGQAPLAVTFRANPEDMDDLDPTFQWHFRKEETNGEKVELFVRYEEDTQYTFTDAGTYEVVVKAFYADQTEPLDTGVVKVVVPASQLEYPNAFSPNDDGQNDTFGPKKGWKSIVSFHGVIINRWGQRLFEWNDPAGEWDGTYKGKPVREGTYFLIVNAKGSDGIVYNIRKDVNLLRGKRDSGNGSGSSTEGSPTE